MSNNCRGMTPDPRLKRGGGESERQGGEERREGERVWGEEGCEGNPDPPMSNTFRRRPHYNGESSFTLPSGLCTQCPAFGSSSPNERTSA